MNMSEANAPPPLPLDDVALSGADVGAPAPMSLDELESTESGPPPDALDLLAESGEAGPAPAPSEDIGAATAVDESAPGPTEGPADVEAGDATLAKLQGSGADEPPAPMPLEELEQLEA